MSMASKFGKTIVNMFTNDKKLNAEKAQAAASELEAAQEVLRRESVKITKTARFGYPFKPTCMAYDSVQHLLAIGTKNGYIKLFGAETVDYTIFHASAFISQNQQQQQAQQQLSGAASSPNGSNTNNISLSGSPILPSNHVSSAIANSAPSAILFLQFIINEGALVVYCDDGTLSFWNLRQKQPGLLFSKKLVNEKATAMHLPFQSNWLYLGTEKGNTYILNVYNNFSQSGYDVKWNNVIEIAQKTKPGKVVHLSDNPLDSSKILIGFDSGLIVLWNIKLKRADLRFNGTAETMSSISWLYDGKQFISSHNNGSLIIWNCKSDAKAAVLHPHMSENDLIPQYNMVRKVSWEANKSGDQFIIFSDGLPSSDCAMRDAITIIKNNKLKTIIEMKEKIIDFLVLSSTPWITGDNPPDPSGIVVLLENNLVVIDLKTENYPQFHHHHAITFHEEPISCFYYMVDPSRAFFQNLQSSRENHSLKFTQKQKQSNNNSNNNNNVTVGGATTSIPFFSQLPYPINGGIKCPNTNLFFYNELIVTGHDDGSVKIWDTSGNRLSLLHKFKTHKYFDKRTSNGQNQIEIDNPFKITAINMSNDHIAVAAAGGHVSLFRYNSKNFNTASEELADIPLLEIPVYYENNQDSKSNTDITTTSGSQSSNSTTLSNDTNNTNNSVKKDLKCYLRTKIGFRRQTGYLPELVCLLMSTQQRIPVVNTILIYSRNNMLLFGTDESIICADYANRSILINLAVVDLYGLQDPFQRMQKSPKKFNKLGVSSELDEANANDSQTHTPNFLSKQFTIEKPSIREASRSSSSSSLENLTTVEGISFISINENTVINSNAENLTQLYQIWLGTTYGSTIILNTSTTTSNSNNSNTASNDNSTNKVKSTSISPTGTIIQSKGQILDISFIQMNGDLYTPINCNLNYDVYARTHKTLTNTNTNNSTNSNKEDLLDMDLDFISNAQVFSNSIADNFKSTTTNANSANTASTTTPTIVNDSASSNSPLSTPSSFVNPFANSMPDEKETKEVKETKEPKESKSIFKNKKSIIRGKENSAPQEIHDRNFFAIITTETQIKVIAMPTQTCVHKYVFTDCHAAKASVVVVNSLTYLSCCMTNGTFMTFNLPNLKPAISVILNSFPHTNQQNDRISRTFTFGTKGHSFYMCSPNEVQKLYLSNNNGSANLSEMLAELFDPKIMTPQQPKPNLFKSIFSVTPFDREELFGESSGKPSTTVIKNLESEVVKATKNEFSELQRNVAERGEKLSALQMKSEQMTQAASQFSKNAQELANKYQKKSSWF